MPVFPCLQLHWSEKYCFIHCKLSGGFNEVANVILFFHSPKNNFDTNKFGDADFSAHLSLPITPIMI